MSIISVQGSFEKELITHTAFTIGFGLLSRQFVPFPLKECLLLGATTSLLTSSGCSALRWDDCEDHKKVAIALAAVSIIYFANFALHSTLRKHLSLTFPYKATGIVLGFNALGQLISFSIWKKVGSFPSSFLINRCLHALSLDAIIKTNPSNPDPFKALDDLKEIINSQKLLDAARNTIHGDSAQKYYATILTEVNSDIDTLLKFITDPTEVKYLKSIQGYLAQLEAAEKARLALNEKAAKEKTSDPSQAAIDTSAMWFPYEEMGAANYAMRDLLKLL